MHQYICDIADSSPLTINSALSTKKYIVFHMQSTILNYIKWLLKDDPYWAYKNRWYWIYSFVVWICLIPFSIYILKNVSHLWMLNVLTWKQLQYLLLSNAVSSTNSTAFTELKGMVPLHLPRFWQEILEHEVLLHFFSKLSFLLKIGASTSCDTKVPNLHVTCKWTYERSYIWTAEKDMILWLIITVTHKT